jgi:hypothetical protein
MDAAVVRLLEILDPEGAFPDYTQETAAKRDIHRQKLDSAGLTFESPPLPLLCNEDVLLSEVEAIKKSPAVNSLIIDITCLPKRFCCFFVKQLTLDDRFRNVVLTYTSPGLAGHTHEHLSEDVLPADYLPGFAGAFVGTTRGLVVSVGFELPGIGSLLEWDPSLGRKMKILLSFPATGEEVRREWRTLKAMFSDEPSDVNLTSVHVVAPWDAELVYDHLQQWKDEVGELVLAPFGPKPHSLGMALFAIKYGSGVVYCQPRSYNPNYSMGIGGTYAYVAKWDGLRCIDRVSSSR